MYLCIVYSRETMAVKHKLVENREAYDCDRLNQILRALQTINTDAANEFPNFCEAIVNCLGTINLPSNPNNYCEFISVLNKVQEILAQACSNRDMVFITLKTLYSNISDSTKNPSPTMSIVLQLIDVKMIPDAVKWILTHNNSEENFKQALMTLCKWLSLWTLTPNLGPLVLALMKGLESEHFYDVLVEVSLKYMDRLFKLLNLLQARRFVAPVVYHMLRCMQYNPDSFHLVIPHIKSIMLSLSKMNDEACRVSEKEIAFLCIAHIRRFPGYSFYEELNEVLKEYASNAVFEEQSFDGTSWQDNGKAVIPLSYTTSGRVGLNNLGNTCYMNSVLQALFMTKLFRNDVLLSRKDAIPLIFKLQSLFTLLQFSQRSSLSPTEILNVARPPGFQPGHQHDSSEFLGYLLDVLHEQEKTIFNSGNEALGNLSVLMLIEGVC